MATITASLETGAVVLTVNTTANTVQVQNTTADKTALFNVFDIATGLSLVWSYQQPANTTNTIAIPTTDNNGDAINWQVGQVTNPKTGVKSQTITSPPWQLTLL